MFPLLSVLHSHMSKVVISAIATHVEQFLFLFMFRFNALNSKQQ
jgi:hypothetical protein